jgi:hypothetical protein
MLWPDGDMVRSRVRRSDDHSHGRSLSKSLVWDGVDMVGKQWSKTRELRGSCALCLGSPGGWSGLIHQDLSGETLPTSVRCKARLTTGLSRPPGRLAYPESSIMSSLRCLYRTLRAALSIHLWLIGKYILLYFIQQTIRNCGLDQDFQTSPNIHQQHVSTCSPRHHLDRARCRRRRRRVPSLDPTPKIRAQNFPLTPIAFLPYTSSTPKQDLLVARTCKRIASGAGNC